MSEQAQPSAVLQNYVQADVPLRAEQFREYLSELKEPAKSDAAAAENWAKRP